MPHLRPVSACWDAGTGAAVRARSASRSPKSVGEGRRPPSGAVPSLRPWPAAHPSRRGAAERPPAGAGTGYVTGRRDRRGAAWAPLPGYWDEIVSRIGTGVSE